MAFTDQYMQTTGADINAGSTTSDAAVYTTTNGNWSTVTNIFTPTDGSTPANSINVNDWVSIYIDAATVAVFTAQVTNVAAGVNGGITVSSSAKYGTAPTTSATGRSLKAGGAWASLAAPVNLYSGSLQGSTRLNIKAGTYANGTTTRSLGGNGSTTVMVWLRGYKSSAGDLASRPATNRVAGTDMPSFTWTTPGGTALSLNPDVTISDIDFQSAGTSGVLGLSGNSRLHRCRITATGAAAGANCLQFNSAPVHITECYFNATTTATQAVNGNSNNFFMVGCVVIGGSVGVALGAPTVSSLRQCVIRNTGSHGLTVGAATLFFVQECTFSACVGDSIRATAGTVGQIMDCLFRNSGGWDINLTVTTVRTYRDSNSSYNPTSGHITGQGDSPDFNDQTESADPVTSGTNMTLSRGSLAYKAGIPSLFENEAYTGFLSIGAVQPDPSIAIVVGPKVTQILVTPDDP